MRTRYDKLIRDRIPEVMEAEGVRFEVTTLDDNAYLDALRAKLVEEATEATEAEGTAELGKELADLLEVVRQLMKEEGLEPSEVEALRERRSAQRGGFERRLWLLWTES